MKQYKIIELPEFEGKTSQEVKDFVEKEYPNQLAKDEDKEDFIKSNPELSDYTWCYFFGSTLRGSSGHWSVPYVRWRDGEWGRSADWLGDGWGSRCCVVLLVDSSCSSDTCSELTLESLNLRLSKLENFVEGIRQSLKD